MGRLSLSYRINHCLGYLISKKKEGKLVSKSSGGLKKNVETGQIAYLWVISSSEKCFYPEYLGFPCD